MNKATLKALKGSIKKWELIVVGKGTDQKTDNCPLCELFINKTGACDGCPVMEKTGKDACQGSPYDAWVRSFEWESHGPFSATSEKKKKLALAELKFLKSLLP